MCMRVESGRTAFEREKQNSPVNPDLCEWPEAYFDESVWFDAWPANLALKTMALDPSKGSDSRRGDYSALVVLGVDRQGMVYVEADLARRPTPEMVAAAAEWFRRFRPDVFAVEANQFQDLLAGEFEAEFRRQGIWLPGRCRSKTTRPSRSASAGSGRISRRAAAVQGRQPRHAAAGRATPRVPGRPTTTTAPTRWKWRSAWPKNFPRPHLPRRPRQPAAGGLRILGQGMRQEPHFQRVLSVLNSEMAKSDSSRGRMAKRRDNGGRCRKRKVLWEDAYPVVPRFTGIGSRPVHFLSKIGDTTAKVSECTLTM